MESEIVDEVLTRASLDGSMDYSSWPELLPTVLARIEKIAHTEFPIPKAQAPPPARPPSPRFLAPLPSSDSLEAPDQTGSPSSQDTNKENADPSSPSAARRASASTNPALTSTATAADPASQQQPPATSTLPKPIADMLDGILSVLRTNFSQYPPHTIQRLSELVLRPRQHYRSLVPYLHALDRVVHVTSGANTYPLPPAMPDIAAMSLLVNGMGGAGPAGLSVDTAAANNLGSDEALGGALLTPIPWLTKRANGGGSDDGSDAGSSSPLSATSNPAQQLQLQQQQQQQQQRQSGHLEGRVQTESTETIEGPNGMGSIETVSVSVNGIPSMGAGVALLTQRSVTQGELLRQEQRAGLVPLNQLNKQHQQQQQRKQNENAQHSSPDTTGEDTTMKEGTDEDEDEIPHARGPAEIGPADTGPQSAEVAKYIAGNAGQVDAQRINVEAAVGRKAQASSAQQQQQQQQQQEEADKANEHASSRTSTSSPEAGERVPQSPKREAADALGTASPAKRRKEDDAAPASGTGAGEGPEPDRTGEPHSDGGRAPPGEDVPGSTRDAEGDVVLPDAGNPDAASTTGQGAQVAEGAVPAEPGSGVEPAVAEDGHKEIDAGTKTKQDTSGSAPGSTTTSASASTAESRGS